MYIKVGLYWNLFFLYLYGCGDKATPPNASFNLGTSQCSVWHKCKQSRGKQLCQVNLMVNVNCQLIVNYPSVKN